MIYLDEARVAINKLQNRCLPSQGDILLPMPLSGEIEFPTTDKMLETLL